MNLSNYKLCDKIIPASYVRQGLEARKVLENRIMLLLEQVCTCIYALAQLKELLCLARVEFGAPGVSLQLSTAYSTPNPKS